MLSLRKQVGLEAKIVLGHEELSLASSICPQTFYFSLEKISVMMELVIIASLQWLSTKIVQLLTFVIDINLLKFTFKVVSI